MLISLGVWRHPKRRGVDGWGVSSKRCPFRRSPFLGSDDKGDRRRKARLQFPSTACREVNLISDGRWSVYAPLILCWIWLVVRQPSGAVGSSIPLLLMPRFCYLKYINRDRFLDSRRSRSTHPVALSAFPGPARREWLLMWLRPSGHVGPRATSRC